MTQRYGSFAIAFGSGFAVLTIEIAGARLIAPVFGLSVVPWTAVIGVILAALAVGSHLGGRMADVGRIPLSRVLVLAGLTGILPIIGAELPLVARDLLGFIPGAVASALVLFAPSVLCLGMVVPYLVQADTESLDAVGRRAGDLSAAATAGSILGSFLTGFVLLPAMPLTVLLGVTSGSLVLMSLYTANLLGSSENPTLLFAALAMPALGAMGGSPPNTLFAEQTLYSSVVVTEKLWGDGQIVRELWQNGGSSSAEYGDGTPAHVYAQASLSLLDAVTLYPDRALVLGGGALTLPVALRSRDHRLEVDVIEIDPAVTELASTYFAYGEVSEGIRVVHEDARVFLRMSEGGYGLVYLDVFDHLLTVPWTMVTSEALQAMSAELSSGGVFMANVLSPLEGPGTEFLSRFRATLDEAFVDVRLYLTDEALDPGATQNLIVVASNDLTVLPELDWGQTTIKSGGRPLTDAWAPVEYLQAKVFAQGLRWR
jgi:spermidine synthase